MAASSESAAAWPHSALPEEPAHGWFQRLAKTNGQISSRTLAESMGLNGRDPVSSDLLEFCLQFPMVNPAQLIAFTPTSDGSLVTFRGETFRANLDFSTKRPRVCPVCLAESRHYRAWFDIQALDRCPDHGAKIINGTDRARLAWWCPDIGILPDGQDLASTGGGDVAEATPWESYVLGRLGIRPFQPCPWLDQTKLHEIIGVAVILGRASDADAIRLAGNSHASRSTFAPRGFDLIKGGPAQLTHSFVSLGESGDSTLFGPKGIFTRSIRELSFLESNKLADNCIDALQEAVQELGVHRRTAPNRGNMRSDNRVTAKVAAEKLGLRSPQVRDLGVRLELIAPVRSHAEAYAFSHSDLAAIRLALEHSITHSEAAKWLGLSPEDFRGLVVAGVVRPLIRMGGGAFHHDRFMPDDVSALLPDYTFKTLAPSGATFAFHEYCALFSMCPIDLALEVIRGERKVDKRDFTQPGFAGFEFVTGKTAEPFHLLHRKAPRSWGGASFTDAAAELGLSQNAIVPLLAAGHLRLSPVENGKSRGICRETLTRFSATYASARLYADLLSLPLRQIHARLRAADIEPLPGIGAKKWCIVEREQVTRRLGPDWDFATQLGTPASTVWREFKASAQALGSPNRLVGGVGLSARLRPGDSSLSADLSVFPDHKWIEVAITGARGPSSSRYARMLAQADVLRSAWPDAAYEHDPKAGIIRLSQALRLPADLSSGELRRVFREIDHAVTVVSHLLKGRAPRLREFHTRSTCDRRLTNA